MSAVSLDLNGYTDIPNDKIAFVVTFLEMLAKPGDGRASETPSGVSLERWETPLPADYVRLFRQIGDDWLWFGRLVLEEDKLANVLKEETREIYCPVQDGKRLGLLEIDFADTKNPELAYFGLVPEAIGSGIGRWLIQQGIELVWRRPESQRFWLHTCTGDSPQALGFYQSNGFRPYKRSIEVVDDPRHLGVLEDALGPHLPKLA